MVFINVEHISYVHERRERNFQLGYDWLNLEGV